MNRGWKPLPQKTDVSLPFCGSGFQPIKKREPEATASIREVSYKRSAFLVRARNRGKMPLPQIMEIFCAFSAGATSCLHGVSNEANKGELSLWERLPAAIPSVCTHETA
jgi:hypothetical protein